MIVLFNGKWHKYAVLVQSICLQLVVLCFFFHTANPFPSIAKQSTVSGTSSYINDEGSPFPSVTGQPSMEGPSNIVVVAVVLSVIILLVLVVVVGVLSYCCLMKNKKEKRELHDLRRQMTMRGYE